ncbi:MAG: hypothetical protein RL584_2013 [Pseudomonadota bacterium]
MPHLPSAIAANFLATCTAAMALDLPYGVDAPPDWRHPLRTDSAQSPSEES